MSFDVDTPKEDPEVTRQREEAEERAEQSRAEENEEASRVGTNKLMRRFGLSRRARSASPQNGQYVPPSYFGFLPREVLDSLFSGQPLTTKSPAFISNTSGNRSNTRQSLVKADAETQLF